MATLTYDYAAGVATLSDLRVPHPMQYDLCASHADRVSVPKGWTLVEGRVGVDGPGAGLAGAGEHAGLVPPLAS